MGIGLAVWAVGVEPGWVVTREHRVAIARWPAELGAVRIAALADLHTGSPHITPAKLRQIIASVNAAQPDLIVLLGDYVIHGVVGGRYVPIEETAAVLRDLRAPAGV
ncbi:MAG TPA: metallophosphoesterase, partial [Methylomirabilota bacterium]